MKKNDLQKVNIHEDYCLWNLICNARRNIEVLQDYVQQYRGYDNSNAYKEYKKVLRALEVYEHAIALMPNKKED